MSFYPRIRSRSLSEPDRRRSDQSPLRKPSLQRRNKRQENENTLLPVTRGNVNIPPAVALDHRRDQSKDIVGRKHQPHHERNKQTDANKHTVKPKKRSTSSKDSRHDHPNKRRIPIQPLKSRSENDLIDRKPKNDMFIKDSTKFNQGLKPNTDVAKLNSTAKVEPKQPQPQQKIETTPHISVPKPTVVLNQDHITAVPKAASPLTHHITAVPKIARSLTTLRRDSIPNPPPKVEVFTLQVQASPSSALSPSFDSTQATQKAHLEDSNVKIIEQKTKAFQPPNEFKQKRHETTLAQSKLQKQDLQQKVTENVKRISGQTVAQNRHIVDLFELVIKSPTPTINKRHSKETIVRDHLENVKIPAPVSNERKQEIFQESDKKNEYDVVIKDIKKTNEEAIIPDDITQQESIRTVLKQPQLRRTIVPRESKKIAKAPIMRKPGKLKHKPLIRRSSNPKIKHSKEKYRKKTAVKQKSGSHKNRKQRSTDILRFGSVSGLKNITGVKHQISVPSTEVRRVPWIVITTPPLDNISICLIILILIAIGSILSGF